MLILKSIKWNEPLFQSYLWKLYFEFLTVKHGKITQYYQQANGFEKFMKTLLKAFAMNTEIWKAISMKYYIILDPVFMQQQVTLKLNYFSIDQ